MGEESRATVRVKIRESFLEVKMLSKGATWQWLKNFSVKDQIVNIFDFSGHMISFAIMYL